MLWMWLVSMALAGGGKEVHVAWDAVPQAVRDAFAAAYPDATVQGATKEDEDGKTVWEVQASAGGRSLDVEMDDAGGILETSRTVDPQDLPQPVRDALGKYKGWSPLRAEESTEGDVVTYEVALAKGKKHREVAFDATGKVVETEKGDD